MAELNKIWHTNPMAKSKVDLGKGFKRIYFVIAAVWGLFLIVYTLAEASECIPYQDYVLPYGCESWWMSSTLGPILMIVIMWSATAIPSYFFLKWIVAVFKK